MLAIQSRSVPQGDEAGVHVGDDVVVLVQLDRVAEQRAAVVPGDFDRTGPSGVDQAAAQPGQASAFFADVGYHPGDVADRTRGRVERARGRVERARGRVERARGRVERGRGRVERARSQVERGRQAI